MYRGYKDKWGMWVEGEEYRLNVHASPHKWQIFDENTTQWIAVDVLLNNECIYWR